MNSSDNDDTLLESVVEVEASTLPPLLRQAARIRARTSQSQASANTKLGAAALSLPPPGWWRLRRWPAGHECCQHRGSVVRHRPQWLPDKTVIREEKKMVPISITNRATTSRLCSTSGAE
jgi:hypothetical protein